MIKGWLNTQFCDFYCYFCIFIILLLGFHFRFKISILLIYEINGYNYYKIIIVAIVLNQQNTKIK